MLSRVVSCVVLFAKVRVPSESSSSSSAIGNPSIDLKRRELTLRHAKGGKQRLVFIDHTLGR